MDNQDKALQDALATLTTEAAVATPTRDTGRRTRIVADVMDTGTAQAYTLAVSGIDVAVVTATGFGEAVLMAHALLPEVRGYIFMWDYAVTDSEGMTLRGSDVAMRTALQDARIANERG